MDGGGRGSGLLGSAFRQSGTEVSPVFRKLNDVVNRANVRDNVTPSLKLSGSSGASSAVSPAKTPGESSSCICTGR